MGESDFAAHHWSSASGAYLRAMRGYYECQRAQTLRESMNVEPPLESSGSASFEPFTNSGHYQLSCYPHACGEFAETMASELDRARATRERHEPGALVMCASPADTPPSAP